MFGPTPPDPATLSQRPTHPQLTRCTTSPRPTTHAHELIILGPTHQAARIATRCTGALGPGGVVSEHRTAPARVALTMPILGAESAAHDIATHSLIGERGTWGVGHGARPTHFVQGALFAFHRSHENRSARFPPNQLCLHYTVEGELPMLVQVGDIVILAEEAAALIKDLQYEVCVLRGHLTASELWDATMEIAAWRGV